MIRADPSGCGEESPQGARRETRRGAREETPALPAPPTPPPEEPPQGPYCVYEYTPPPDPAEECRWWPPHCPRSRPLCPCVSRVARTLQSWADGVGAWPSGRWVSSLVCPALLLLQLWALAYCFLGPVAAPDGELFRLVATFVVAKMAGWLVHKVSDAPALVGMLIIGVATRNTGYLAMGANYVDLIAGLRKTALVLIMVRAGLGLDPSMLRSLSLQVLGLALVPATVEVASVTVCAYLLLQLPWLWGLLLGMVLAAVAPSVVMPCFIELRAQRFGVDKGIDTLVIAAASFDDVVAISLFGVVLGLIFTGGTSAQELVQHPLGLFFGILYGCAWGKVIQFLPTKDAKNVTAWRAVLLLGGGLVVSFGSDALGYHEAGPVGCIAAAFTASSGWRAAETAVSVEAVERYFAGFWVVFEPIMFSLIGADIDTSLLDGGTVGLSAACILISLLFRMVSTWLLMFTGDFNWKERLFVALAWLPKADVQAALGPLALDMARKEGRLGDEARAAVVLVVAALSILLTAPAGAAVISVLGRRLLSPSPPSESGTGRPDRPQHGIVGGRIRETP